MQQVYDRYIAPHYLGYAFSGLYTPAQFQPWTGIPSLTYDQSVAEGAGYLHTAIMQQVAAGNDVVVLGFSQGASVATLEMRHLASLPAGVAPSRISSRSYCWATPTTQTGASSPGFRVCTCSRSA